MARIKILLLLVVFGGPVVPAWSAEGAAENEGAALKWYESYEEGVKAAGEGAARPLFLYFHASWCGWCRRLEQEVFTQKEVIAALQRFVCVRVDVEKEPKAAVGYGVRSLPHLFVINSHRQVVGDWLGYREGEELVGLFRDIESQIDRKVEAMDMPEVETGPGQRAGPVEVVLPSPDDVEGVLALLGDRDVRVRKAGIGILVEQGPRAAPIVLRALTHKYLQVRIAGWKVVRTWWGKLVSYDPWASGPERTEAAEAVEKELAKKKPPGAATRGRDEGGG